MSLLDIIVYSLIQAICEFLPVSSSAHLALVPRVLKINDPGIIFDLFLHFGSTLAVILYFRKKIIEILKEGVGSFKHNFLKSTFFKVGLVTFVSVIFIFIFKDIVYSLRGNLVSIAIGLIIFAIFLSLSDILGAKKKSDFLSLNLLSLFLVGLFQSFAVFPGVSRSGATITVLRFFGLEREKAGEFSFLISIPIILIGTLYKCLEVFKGDVVVNFEWANLFLGVVLTFIFSYIVIHFFLRILKRWSLHPFSFYRVILGVILLSI